MVARRALGGGVRDLATVEKSGRRRPRRRSRHGREEAIAGGALPLTELARIAIEKGEGTR